MTLGSNPLYVYTKQEHRVVLLLCMDLVGFAHAKSAFFLFFADFA